MSVRDGEWAAFLILERITAQGAYLNLAMAEVFNELKPDDASRAMATALVRTTIENNIALDFALTTVTDTRRCGRAVRNILGLSAARMLYMHTEDAAVVNAAVELCKKAGKQAQSSYVNGVLRSLAATKQDIRWPKQQSDPHQYLSVRYSWPLWAVKQAEKQLGFEKAEEMLKQVDQTYVTIRVNRQKSDVDNAVSILEATGGRVERSSLHPWALRVWGIPDITGLSAYTQGLFSLQGEASLLLCEQVPETSLKVMDLCAAPGGKTCALAERLVNAQILSYDIHPHRVELIRKQLHRLDIKNVTVEVHDATIPLPEHKLSADAVLIDAPCSGLGTARKRPDVKLNRDFEDVLALSNLQKEILEAAFTYVKPGGVMIYGTCTFIRQENRDVTENFLKGHPDFALIPLALPDLFADQGQSGILQLWPHIHTTDGFFMARMQRRG